MKIRILLTLLLTYTLSSIGQTKKDLEVKSFFWGENDTHKNATEIPDKWKSESAVILYKNQNYDFHKFAKNVTYTTSLRKRIKLLDKSAVKEFSEFSFSDLVKPPTKVMIFPVPVAFNLKKRKDKFVGIKVIKPNGEEIEVDVEKESVQEDGKTKIAISNLEVGDIIDYYIYKEDPFKSTYAFGFDPVETTLAEDYPIVDFKLFFETENDFFINFNSYNGAPELKNIPTGKKNFRRYSLESSNIDKFMSNRWFYPLVDLPSYKFQVYFARSGKFENRALAFLPEKENIIKKNVTKEEVLELYDKRFRPDGDNGDLKGFLKDKTFKNDSEKVTAVFYYMRHIYLTRYIEAYTIKEAGILYYPFGYYGNHAKIIKDQKRFIQFFTEFLKQEKIGFEIVVAKKRYDGSIDDLLIEKNVNVLLKVKTQTPVYVEYFGLHTCVNEFSPLIENTDVYLLTKSKNKIDGIKKGKLSVSTPSLNESKRNTTLTINDDFSSINISLVNSFKGHQKKDEQYNKLLFTDYVNEDYEKYETQPFIELVKRKKDKAKYKKEIDALIIKLKDKQKERLKKSIESEFKVEGIEDYSFEINETGRFSFDSYFTYSESFKVKNAFIKKAGPNYIVEIGKLITAQIDLTEKERARKENVHMNYPRSYNNKIVFNIPENYTVSGLDKLKKSVDNITGAFISDAKIEGNTLIVTTTKQYKNNYEPNSNWPLMVDFLDAANQFTNEKILLKKK
ncbi:DUF3857 domain-containing protein [Flavivirga eckloniae]|uniref:DUF3857 domain-containing protein n=1 Tax=Flavivirga eckloniae TaxID=1803846 RepID=A0A2K9PVJ0_9FLAO|nr:DUF3857 domain-containing protein [Flavivirga eckloniae]AUP81090.1 hypothetical protein C1H87_21185 [Flavivirga eckloniae]